MVFLKDWEDFEIAAESMYQQNPSQCRYTMKYTHQKGQLLLKLTDNVKVCVCVCPFHASSTITICLMLFFFIRTVHPV